MRTLKSDLHIHRNFSDGKLSIPEIVDLYGQNKFSVIAITDHICEAKSVIGRLSHHLKYCLSIENHFDYFETLLEEGVRAWKEYEMLLIPGYEITMKCLTRGFHSLPTATFTGRFILPPGKQRFIQKRKHKKLFLIPFGIKPSIFSSTAFKCPYR